MFKKKIERNKLISVGADEIYCDWFLCPFCKERNITNFFKFCPDCGAEILGEIDDSENIRG